MGQVVLVDPTCFIGGAYHLYSFWWTSSPWLFFFDAYIVGGAYYRSLTPWACHLHSLTLEEQERLSIFICTDDPILGVPSLTTHIARFFGNAKVHLRRGVHGCHLMFSSSREAMRLAIS